MYNEVYQTCGCGCIKLTSRVPGHLQLQRCSDLFILTGKRTTSLKRNFYVETSFRRNIYVLITSCVSCYTRRRWHHNTMHDSFINFFEGNIRILNPRFTTYHIKYMHVRLLRLGSFFHTCMCIISTQWHGCDIFYPYSSSILRDNRKIMNWWQFSNHDQRGKICGYQNTTKHELCTLSGGRLNKKDGLTRYGNSHVKDKTS